MKQKEYQILVQPGEDVRIDKYLSDQLPEISRTRVKRLIENGYVNLDGLAVEKGGTKIKPGQTITVLVPDDEVDSLVPENIPLDILFENADVLVLNKAAGMVVHPGAGNSSRTLVNALLAYYPPIRSVGEVDRPGVVHRLDKETSGVLIFAKTDKAYKWLVKQFKSRDMQKTYLALVDGAPPTPTGRIEAPIERDHNIRTKMAVGLWGQGKPAVSEYYTMERFKNQTYLEVHLITGRTHQIRVHLSYIGVPVVGDTLYGHRNQSIEMSGFFLHAKSLSIKLFGERAPRSFEAPLPAELENILSEIRRIERKTG